jgi:hypothetical protein
MYGGIATLNPIPTTLTWNPPRHHHGWIAALFVADVLLFVTPVAMTGLMTASTSFVTVVDEEDAIDLEASIRPLLSPPLPMLFGVCAVIFSNDGGWGFASKIATITPYACYVRRRITKSMIRFE